MRKRVFIVNDTTASHHYGCDLVMSSLRHMLAGAGMELVGTFPVRKDWRKHPDLLPRQGEVDGIIVNGEGSIHRSETRARARFLPEIAPFARRELGVPAFLINGTLHELSDAVLDDIRVFERCYVRDTASAALLARAGIRATVVPDLSMSHEMPESGVREGILVTDSVMSDRREVLRRYALDHGHDYLPMGRIHYPEGEEAPSLDEFLATIVRSSLVVTGRYHVVCICLATKTPFIAIESNSPKISSVCRDILGSRRRVWAEQALERGGIGDYARWTVEESARLALLQAKTRMATESMMSCIRGRLGATVRS